MINVILNNKLDITEYIASANLSGDSTKFNRQLSLQMNMTQDGRTRGVTVVEGDVLVFRSYDAVRFIGYVFATERSSDGMVSITAYDSNIYLAKSNDSRIFINKKASEITSALAKDFGIPTGSIADTGYVIPFLRLSNKSLFDMILTALKLTYQQTGKRFFVGNTKGKLTLIAGAEPEQRFLFKDGENLISASYSRSIEDTKTQVKVIGGKKGSETIVSITNEGAQKKYGVLQALEVMDESATASQVKQRAQTLLKEQSVVSEQFNVEVLGVPEVDVGTAVYVQNEMTSVSGAFYVTSVSHDYNGGLHTMSLELSRTYELPDIDIDEEATQA